MFKAVAHRLVYRLRTFGADRTGSILPMFAIMAVVVIVVAGASIDYGRAVNSREVMANALDSAALAVASKLSTSIMTDAEIDLLAKQVFEANLESLGLKEVAVANLDAVVDADGGTVTVNSRVSVPTYFIHIGGIGPESLDVGVETVVNYSKFDVELALVLDVTGSMSGDMEALKEAAGDLVDVLIPDGTSTSDSKVRISIIPYSQGVNLGEFAQKVTNGDKGTRNCVTERLGEAQFTDDPYDYEPDDPSAASTTYFGGGSNSCAATPQMEPLTSKRNKLTTAIKKLTASGGTAGQTGIAWGWYSLSPNWTNLWPSDSAPESYSDREVLKFAVIMTDGNNNRYYDYNAYVYNYYYDKRNRRRLGWFYCEGWCESLESETYSNESSTRSRELCDAMAETGIEIYGVYFGTSNNSVGARNMKSCASSSNSYYQATSSSDLVQAFGNIAKKIQAIYLAK